MANLDTKTRREQILSVLLDHAGDWVDGSRLATEEVGGSEGLRRLRELVAEGYPIDKRPHPDPRRAIWQYRYRRANGGVSITDAVLRAEQYEYVPAKPALIETPEADEVETGAFVRLPKPINFGEVAVCPRCRGKTRRYNYSGLDDLRHKDPYVDKLPCKGCNGWGIVPNRGPIPMTAPEGLSS